MREVVDLLDGDRELLLLLVEEVPDRVEVGEDRGRRHRGAVAPVAATVARRVAILTSEGAELP